MGFAFPFFFFPLISLLFAGKAGSPKLRLNSSQGNKTQLINDRALCSTPLCPCAHSWLSAGYVSPGGGQKGAGAEPTSTILGL